MEEVGGILVLSELSHIIIILLSSFPFQSTSRRYRVSPGTVGSMFNLLVRVVRVVVVGVEQVAAHAGLAVSHLSTSDCFFFLSFSSL